MKQDKISLVTVHYQTLMNEIRALTGWHETLKLRSVTGELGPLELWDSDRDNVA